MDAFLPFLRDLARQFWPDWDVTRAVFADFLEDAGDPRASQVRSTVCDVWDGQNWTALPFGDPGTAASQADFGFDGKTPLAVSPRSRGAVLSLFPPLRRVRIQPAHEHDWPAGLALYVVYVDLFLPWLWRRGHSFDVERLWSGQAVARWLSYEDAVATAKQHAAENPEIELAFPTELK
jgi:uncharacterized protein (TIGR02996 family)